MRWADDRQSSLGSRLRTLLVLCVVAALVVSMLAEATLRGSVAAPSWLNLGGASTNGASVPPPAAGSAEPELAAAKKGKGHKQKADKQNKQKQNKDKGKKQGKHKGNNHKGDKKGKQKGSKKGKHKGDKGQNDKGKKHDKHKGNKKGKGKNDSQKKSGLSAASLGAPSVTLNPVADAKVSEAKPTLNYGTTPDLLVDGAADPDVESYLLFDVSGISPPIHQATLRLHVQPSGGTVNGPEVRAIGTSWTESNLTWNTRPAPSGGVLDDKVAMSGNSWVEYNVTAAVTGNGQVAFVLLPQSNDGAVFDSGETTTPPELVITYGELPPTPTPSPPSTPTPTPPPTPTPTPTSTPTPPPATSPLTLAPVADAKVNEAKPALNYGGTADLLVDGAADPDVESYLRFDVAGVNAPVQQATLRLRVQPSGGTVNGPEVRATGSGWSETGLTWNNRPAPNGGVLDDKANLSGGTWVEYNVTAAVSGDGSYSFALLPQSNDGAVFESRETATSPQLVVVFGETPPTPTPAPTATPTPSPTPTPTPTPTPPPDPNSRVVMAAGDNVCGADSTGGSCKQVEVSDLVLAANPDAVLVLGDVQYECGEASDFTSFYDPSWGRGPIKNVTHPAAGNHEYRTSTDPAHPCFGNPPDAQAFFDYFGPSAGQVGQGYYSFDLGDWHLIALNSNCGKIGGCGVGSPQWDWLTADLAAHPNSCTLAYWHAPLYSSGGRASPVTQALYQALYDANADLVLTGHDHTYERFAPQDANAQVDNARGIRQFVVGTGGRNLTSWGPPAANSEVKDNDTFGVLELTLRPNSYDWQFVPIAGESFTDSGNTPCH